MVGQFQGEERDVFIDKSEEDLVAFPQGEFEEALFVDPFEVAFVAGDLLAGPVGTHEEVHVFGGPLVGDEGDDAAVAPLGDGKAGLFADLTQHTVFGALSFFELASHAEPFVVIEVVFFFRSVQHKVLVAALEVTEGGWDQFRIMN